MPSFDIVSKTDIHEVDNAVAGVAREIGQRFDFKGSKSTLAREDNAITILAEDETKLRQLQELLRMYMTRRKLDPAALDFQKAEAASGNMLRQKVVVRQGVDQETGKRIAKAIKDSKIKVQVAIQGDELRVSGKKKDDLQAAIAQVRGMELDLPLQFVNMRS